MHESRPPFSDAVAIFRRFLIQNSLSHEIRWLSAEDITGYRGHFWVYRPKDLANEQLSEAFYTAAIATTSSVRIDAFFQYGGFTLAVVQNMGGDSHFLNFGILTSPYLLSVVTSPLMWSVRRAINRLLCRQSPILQGTTIPNCG